VVPRRYYGTGYPNNPAEANGVTLLNKLDLTAQPITKRAENLVVSFFKKEKKGISSFSFQPPADEREKAHICIRAIVALLDHPRVWNDAREGRDRLAP
jgi:hypothetical protein